MLHQPKLRQVGVLEYYSLHRSFQLRLRRRDAFFLLLGMFYVCPAGGRPGLYVLHAWQIDVLGQHPGNERYRCGRETLEAVLGRALRDL